MPKIQHGGTIHTLHESGGNTVAQFLLRGSGVPTLGSDLYLF